MIIKKFKYNVKKINEKYNFNIYNASTLSNPKDNTIIFLKKDNEELLEKLKNIKNSILIINDKLDAKKLEEYNLVIYDENPRLRYAQLLTEILKKDKKEYKNFFKDGYYFGENIEIGKNVIIEPFVKIGSNIQIGDNTIIKSGALIENNVKIGKNCYIREKSVIGGEDFGIERDKEGRTFRIPHIGGVIIGDNVEVGTFSTVCSGTIEATIVEDYVKIDTGVNVGHNTKIGKGTLITAGVIIGGSTIVGKNCTLGLNSSIKNGIQIGNNVILGMAARIVKSIEDNQILTNEKADTLENIIKFSNYKKEILKKL
ncbi:UDP-3-O-(3-hydroxymyristoyl)glucosamine N-acyltransferase [Fusobacterium varium]|jgi:UDP-3-O-[3-hydroxymyristoyl] glucosamine N-acyltransferase LpxD|uniref:UDP-3-O-(3-hydroxymyristoyl)glucosamine N-acyltransferase n=1 Tax=Fusobacterium varium TaxID=856 RepID=UPI0022E1D9CB|nr:UDP-3-O-(3-hydroxymyristoyl)glucosamine N-acyltransferase [Fusobacterium varium]